MGQGGGTAGQGNISPSHLQTHSVHVLNRTTENRHSKPTRPHPPPLDRSPSRGILHHPLLLHLNLRRTSTRLHTPATVPGRSRPESSGREQLRFNIRAVDMSQRSYQAVKRTGQRGQHTQMEKWRWEPGESHNLVFRKPRRVSDWW